MAMVLTGCATLSVSPEKKLKAVANKQPVTIGVQATGERLREALENPAGSLITTASGSVFEKVIILSPQTRFMTAAEITASDPVDYILTLNLSDINVNGNLNPIWFASFPLFFFKPFAPIVTFEANVTLDSTLRDARSGAIVAKKEISDSVTDHFSPYNPQEKVRKLISLGINNAVVDLFGELPQTIAASKTK